MTCETPATDGRTVITSTGYRSNGWWTGIVHDRDPETDERRIRLERAVRDNRGTWSVAQSWRVRPDFWPKEQSAVRRLDQGAGRREPPVTPVDESLPVQRYLKVRRDDRRWVAAVEVFNEHRNTKQKRLYHWELPAESRRQCWTVGRNWSKLQPLVDRHLAQVA